MLSPRKLIHLPLWDCLLQPQQVLDNGHGVPDLGEPGGSGEGTSGGDTSFLCSPPILQGTVGRGTLLTWAARSISCSRAFFTALVIMTGEYFSSSSFSCEGRREVTQLPGPRGSHNAVTRGHPWPCLQDPHAPGLCPPGG